MVSSKHTVLYRHLKGLLWKILTMWKGVTQLLLNGGKQDRELYE